MSQKFTQLQTMFDANQVDPASGGSSQLPIGTHVVAIVDSELRGNKSGGGGHIYLELQVQHGANAGAKGAMRLNIHHEKETVVRIAYAELSAICWAIGRPTISDTTELHGVPFAVEVGLQKGQETYTEVKKILNADGSPVVKGQTVQQSQGGGYPQAPAPQQPQGVGYPQQAPAPAPAPQPPMGPPQAPAPAPAPPAPVQQAPAPAAQAGWQGQQQQQAPPQGGWNGQQQPAAPPQAAPAPAQAPAGGKPNWLT